MGWGDPFSSAWNSATGKARQLGSAISNGWDSTKRRTVEKMTQTRDWAVQRGTQVRDHAVRHGTNTVRAVEQGALRGAETAGGWINRGANAVGNAGNSLARGVNRAGNRIRSAFGREPVAEACPTCNGQGTPRTDVEADGWYMGAGCTPKRTLDEAKASPTRPDANNTCCRGKTRQRPIYYVNGIKTTRAAHCKTLREIANSTCANVIGIYNATQGFALDALQTGGDRQLINRAANGSPPRLDGRNLAVNTVSNTVYNEVQAGEKPEIWAHSQGGAVTSLGLYSADNRLQLAGNRNRLSGMNVTSFGSAAPRWVNGPNYEHYVHVNDITPVSLGLGGSAEAAGNRGGSGSTIHRFSGNPQSGWVNDGEPGFRRGVLTPQSNHGIEATYIAKRDRDKGGCGQSHNAQAR
jgi:hypothetical protein